MRSSITSKKRLAAATGVSALLALPLAVHANNSVLLTKAPSLTSAGATACIDGGQVLNAATNTVLSGAVMAPGFKTPTLANATFAYNPTNTPRPYGNLSGIARPSRGFGGPATPEGVPVGLVQNSGGAAGSISQALDLGVGVATLSGLAVSAGALSPSFAAGTTSYTVTVPAATASTTITPTATQLGAIITVNGTAVVSGTASGSITLAYGTTTLTVVVTAQDGITTQTYTVAITRPCALQAVAQPLTVQLNAAGTATVTGAQVGGASSGTCAPVTYTLQRIVSGSVGEHLAMTLTAPAGKTFGGVAFASYGTPVANANGTFAINSNCHAGTSAAVVGTAIANQNTATIMAENTDFGDPCPGTVKTLSVLAAYSGVAPQLVFDCADLGTSQVLLTATDAQGNMSTAVTTITVRDVLAPGVGTGPLPAAPAAALAAVPEAAGYGILYQLDAPTVGRFNLLGVPYGINNSAAALSPPARVAYFVELTNGTSSKWVWTSMDNFASTLTGLGIPNPLTNNVTLHQNVTNLSVYASTNTGLTTGAALGAGRIEMWPYDYATNNSDNVPGASGSLYDMGDVSSGTNGYGSFQVHNLGAAQTVFAYNNWGINNDASDLGIGNQTGGSGHPDWTFARNAGSFSVKRITVLVPNVGILTKPAALVLPASGVLTVQPSDVLKSGVGDNCGIASMTVTPSILTCANLGANTVQLTLTDASGNKTVASATVAVSVPVVSSTTWTGTASSDWNDCRNWSYGQAPTALISAVLPGNTPNAPAVPIGTGLVKDVNIGGTTGLSLGSGGTLLVYGNWDNTSTASNLAGTVSFIGLGAQTINQPSPARFGTVVVNKLTGTLALAQSMAVNTALTLTSGVLTTGAYEVQLAPTATITESETSYVTGSVATSRTIGSAAESFGGLGLVLTPASGSVAPGATAVVRTTGTTLSGSGPGQSIQRYFDISPATNSGLNIGMAFSYFDHELNGIPKANLVLYKSTTTPSGPWTGMNGTSDVVNNRVLKTGLADFSIWTLGNAANPLPVALLDFAAQPQAAAVALTWHTASELNSARFDIERSTDGSTYGKLGTVAAQGTTSHAHAYTFRDAQLPLGATTLYYRLRQVDADGTYTFSPVRVVSVAGAGSSTSPLVLFPNPTTATATLTGAPAQVAVKVLDALGRTVYATITTAAGTASLDLPAGLPKGVYVVRAGTQAARLTVE